MPTTGAKSIAATLAALIRLPVAVKWPACPVVAHLPKETIEAVWDAEVAEDVVRLLARNTEGAMTGFIATGRCRATRSAYPAAVSSMRSQSGASLIFLSCGHVGCCDIAEADGLRWFDGEAIRSARS
jgi:hypothetical protein